MSEKAVVACTIVSQNYLGFAATVSASYLMNHPNHQFVVLIVDEPTESLISEQYPFEVVFAKDLPIPDFRSIAFQFDILELNTNVKPTFLKYLFQQKCAEKVIYLDPDIFCYQPFDTLLALLDGSSIVLTPHCTQPIRDEYLPTEQDFLRTGIFNLGFIGLRHSEETLRLLDWWEQRCLSRGYHEIPSGLFVDQKWMNLAPCFFSSVHILKHPGYNMAYWNLHERSLGQDGSGRWVVNGTCLLVFFHFSGIDLNSLAGISKYQNRFDLANRPDLAELFLHYEKSLRTMLQSITCTNWRYSYGYFSDGKAVPQLTRRLFGKFREQFDGVDPFDAQGPFYVWARRKGLVAGYSQPPRYSALTYDKQDWRLQLIHKSLLIILRVVGVTRYTMLMKYLSFISVLGNQAELFRDDRSSAEKNGAEKLQ